MPDVLEQLKSQTEDDLDGLGEALALEKARRKKPDEDEEPSATNKDDDDDEEEDEESPSWLGKLMGRKQKKSVAAATAQPTFHEEMAEDPEAGQYILAEPFLGALTKGLSRRLETADARQAAIEEQVGAIGEALVDIHKSLGDRDTRSADLVKSIADSVEQMGKTPQLRQSDQYSVLEKGGESEVPGGGDNSTILKKSMEMAQTGALTSHEANVIFKCVQRGMEIPAPLQLKMAATTPSV